MSLSLIDISSAIRNPDTCLFVNKLKGGHPCMFSPTLPISGSGSFATAYKYELADGSLKAIRIWTKEDSSIRPILESSQEVSKELSRIQSHYFVDYEFYNDAILINGKRYPLLIMDWCDGLPLKEYIRHNLDNPRALGKLADNFLMMFRYMHKNSISHGDLQHGNIMVDKEGKIRLLDYDSLYFPTSFFANKSEVVKGYESYQHPNRKKNHLMGPKVDYFSELIIYISILAIRESPSLWNEYNVSDNDTRLLFSEIDFKDLSSSPLFSRLSSFQSPLPQLLNVLKMYLQENDILRLNPFDSYIKLKYMESLYPVYCIRCGTKMEYGDNYCWHCGSKLIYN